MIIINHAKNNPGMLDSQSLELEQLSAELDAVKKQLQEMARLLKFGVDRQYYFNAFSNPELLKLQNEENDGILLCGNYGNPNTGDEWMLDTMIQYLHKYTNKKITLMLEPNRIFDPSIYLKYDVNYIHYPQTIYDYDIIAEKFDVLIFGGGAIIEDEIYWEAYDYGINICRTVVDLPLRFIAKNKKVFCIGLSTSKKLSNPEYIQKLQTVVCGAIHFSVRDQYSLNVLEQVGISTDRIQVINDIVYANEALPSIMQNIKPEKHSEPVHIGIVYIVAEETKESFYSLVANIKKEMQKQKKDYIISLIPFYDDWHIDLNFYKLFAKDEENIEVLPYITDITEMIKIFLQQDFMVCARYHAILLTLSLNIPCIGLYYDTHQHYFNKISYLLEQFQYCLDDCIPMSQIKKMENSIFDKVICVKDKKITQRLLDETRETLDDLFARYL